MPDNIQKNINNRLIGVRGKLLDLVTSTGSRQVLNSAAELDQKQVSSDMAAEIKTAVDKLKTSGISEDGSVVDYRKLRTSQPYREYRQEYAPRLRSFDLQQLSDDSEKLAFWINLYNTLVIDAVIAYDVHKSVAGSLFEVLAFFRRAAYEVDELRFSLEDIEHGVLRGNRGHPYIPGPHFAEDDARLQFAFDTVHPRIHFALNCASRSCPPIRFYSARNIEPQLNMAAKNFVSAETTLENNILRTSAIFKWYEMDFTGSGGVIDFIRDHHTDPGVSEKIHQHRDHLQLKFSPYDWGLNSMNNLNQSENSDLKMGN